MSLNLLELSPVRTEDLEDDDSMEIELEDSAGRFRSDGRASLASRSTRGPHSSRFVPCSSSPEPSLGVEQEQQQLHPPLAPPAFAPVVAAASTSAWVSATAITTSSGALHTHGSHVADEAAVGVRTAMAGVEKEDAGGAMQAGVRRSRSLPPASSGGGQDAIPSPPTVDPRALKVVPVAAAEMATVPKIYLTNIERGVVIPLPDCWKTLAEQAARFFPFNPRTHRQHLYRLPRTLPNGLDCVIEPHHELLPESRFVLQDDSYVCVLLKTVDPPHPMSIGGPHPLSHGALIPASASPLRRTNAAFMELPCGAVASPFNFFAAPSASTAPSTSRPFAGHFSPVVPPATASRSVKAGALVTPRQSRSGTVLQREQPGAALMSMTPAGPGSRRTSGTVAIAQAPEAVAAPPESACDGARRSDGALEGSPARAEAELRSTPQSSPSRVERAILPHATALPLAEPAQPGASASDAAPQIASPGHADITKTPSKKWTLENAPTEHLRSGSYAELENRTRSGRTYSSDRFVSSSASVRGRSARAGSSRKRGLEALTGSPPPPPPPSLPAPSPPRTSTGAENVIGSPSSPSLRPAPPLQSGPMEEIEDKNENKDKADDGAADEQDGGAEVEEEDGDEHGESVPKGVSARRGCTRSSGAAYAAEASGTSGVLLRLRSGRQVKAARRSDRRTLK
ncbi:hypothetical protein OC844_004697 [Tilletia horrida]|nr:hypothetical protein OC844_004697 [Tilletia horrida]